MLVEEQKDKIKNLTGEDDYQGWKATGSASVLAVVREAGPIATSLLIAAQGGQSGLVNRRITGRRGASSWSSVTKSPRVSPSIASLRARTPLTVAARPGSPMSGSEGAAALLTDSNRG